MRKQPPKQRDRQTEKSEENKFRAYFVRLFGKYDFRNEAQFLYFGKWMIFILLLLVETLAILQRIQTFSENTLGNFLLFLSVMLLLTISMGIQLFAVRGKGRLVFYYIDAIAACAFLFFADGAYALVVYILVLTQFYFEVQKTKKSLLLLLLSVLLYTIAYGLQRWIFHSASWNTLQVLSQSAGFMVAVLAHFILVQIALAFYRQYLRLDKTLQELDESKKELEKAYAVVAEVTALEERQRIAKDIHDTAGHSITTVIMQTETAKRLLEVNPEEAKSKIVSANLQARHALEELRDSVHLLSGIGDNATVSEALAAIIHESTDGTGIAIRSEIDEVTLSPAKHRFLCNTLKEGISNGLRHGGATAFWFELKKEERGVSFLLSDNGKGADEDFQKGFGLTTMEERARALGGEIRLFSDGEGFELHLTLPLSRPT